MGPFLGGLMAIECFIACIGYLYAGDIPHSAYWLFAGAMTYIVTWWLK